ncbi:MAG: hypothetical protein RBU30_02195 [Polyangia bacterium]|jgi:hypothetical protein|nr:hypothetical protein [Polyangia bacterium]
MTIEHKRICSLLGFGVTLSFWTSCVVTVQPASEPTAEPPPAPAIALTCGPNQYVHGGRHTWRNGAWVWEAPVCMARPATWREGCRWTRGRWVRSGNRMVFQQGSLYCPEVTAAEPISEPPPPPPVALTCGPNEYLQGGRHVWRNGAWGWEAPACVARPQTWREGCRWVRGSWTRVGGRLVFSAGRLSCPEAVVAPEPVVADPEDLPPPPPTTYRPARCSAQQVFYPGRYVWNSATRQWDWQGGVCIGRPAAYARCKWVPGSWRYHNGRAYYIQPAWDCAGKVTYWTQTGSAWTPPATYNTFIGWKPCGPGMRHDANGRCVRYCGPGSQLKGNRCVAIPKPLVCPAGTEARGNKCVKIPPPKRCPPGQILEGNRCVRQAPPPKRCPPGQILEGNRCVRQAPPPKRCPPGQILEGNRCVRQAPPPKRCPPGQILEGNRCVRQAPPHMAEPAKRCPEGQVLEGNRCVRKAPPAMTPPAKRCPEGQVLEGNRCVRKAPPAMTPPAKRCPEGQVLRGKRCVPR